MLNNTKTRTVTNLYKFNIKYISRMTYYIHKYVALVLFLNVYLQRLENYTKPQRQKFDDVI